MTSNPMPPGNQDLIAARKLIADAGQIKHSNKQQAITKLKEAWKLFENCITGAYIQPNLKNKAKKEANAVRRELDNLGADVGDFPLL